MNPTDPGDPFDPMGSARPSSAAPKVLAALVGFVVVALIAAGGLLLVANSGGDDGDDEASEVATDDEADESDDPTVATSPPETTEAPEDDADEEPVDKPDADGDGIPDVDDPDDDGGEPGDDDEDPVDEGPPAVVDLLRTDPRPAVDAWIDAAGDGAKAVEVVLYPDYGFADIRDPERPNKLLEFGWRDGAVQGPESAEPFPGTDLDAESFRMTRVNWDALPRLVANAPERAGFPRGEVTHVIVTSDRPFSERFLFRIYVTAPNGSDYVVATIDGRPAPR